MNCSRSILLVALCALFTAACGPDDEPSEEAGVPQFELETTQFSLDAEVGESDEATVTIANPGAAGLQVTFMAEDDSWLAVRPSQFFLESEGSRDVRFIGECDEVGEFSTDLMILTNDPDFEETSVQVNLSCVEARIPAGLSLQNSVNLEANVDDGDQEVVTVANSGNETLDVEFAVEDASWLELDPLSLSLEAGEETDVVVSAQCEEAGEFSTDVLVTSTDPDKEETTLSVMLTCYGLDRATLTVTVTGLPDEIDAQVDITGPDDFSANLTESEEFLGLLPGQYTITAAQIGDAPVYYLPVDEMQIINLAAQDDDEITITYEQIIDPGTLQVNIDLPSALDFDLEVRDGDDVVATRTLTGDDTTIFDDLAPGTYTLAPSEPLVDQWGNEFLAADLTGFGESIEIIGNQAEQITLNGLPPALVRTGDDEGAYSLREVIGRVNEGTEVRFVDDLTAVVIHSGAIEIDVSLSIIGPGEEPISIAVQGAHRIFTIAADTVTTLDSLILEAGDAGGVGDSGQGGAIFSAGDLTLNNIHFLNNLAEYGAALYATGDVVIENSRFETNASFEDGGAAQFDGAAQVEISNSLFTNNSSTGDGGALHIQDADVLITNSTFYDNSTSYAGSSDTGAGGAIFVGALGSLDLVHVSISANNANEASGLFFNENTRIASSLIADNGDADIAAAGANILESGGYNIISRAPADSVITLASDIIGTLDAPESANIETFAAADVDQLATLSLETTSSAYRAIPEADCVDFFGEPVTRDQRGVVRPAEGACTIGAWEDGEPVVVDPGGDWTTVETFDNATQLEEFSYTAATFTGVDGIEWAYEEARSAQNSDNGDYSVDGEGLIFKSGSGMLRADSIPDDILTIRVDYMKAFTSGSAREFKVLINDEIVATTDAFGGFSGADTTVFTLDIAGLNVDGPFSLEVRNLGAQFTLDNIRWR